MSYMRTVAGFLMATMVALCSDVAVAGDDRTTRFYEDARTRLSTGDR